MEKLLVEMFWNWHLLLISPNMFTQSFRHEDPKSTKRQSSHQYSFVLLGFSRVKADRKWHLKCVVDRGKTIADASVVASTCSISGARVRLVRTTTPRPEPEECDGSAVTGLRSTTMTVGPCCDFASIVDLVYWNLMRKIMKRFISYLWHDKR